MKNLLIRFRICDTEIVFICLPKKIKEIAISGKNGWFWRLLQRYEKVSQSLKNFPTWLANNWKQNVIDGKRKKIEGPTGQHSSVRKKTCCGKLRKTFQRTLKLTQVPHLFVNWVYFSFEFSVPEPKRSF